MFLVATLKFLAAGHFLRQESLEIESAHQKQILMCTFDLGIKKGKDLGVILPFFVLTGLVSG